MLDPGGRQQQHPLHLCMSYSCQYQRLTVETERTSMEQWQSRPLYIVASLHIPAPPPHSGQPPRLHVKRDDDDTLPQIYLKSRISLNGWAGLGRAGLGAVRCSRCRTCKLCVGGALIRAHFHIFTVFGYYFPPSQLIFQTTEFSPPLSTLPVVVVVVVVVDVVILLYAQAQNI